MTIKNGNFDRFIGDRIKLAREEAGLTQIELSKKIGFKDRQTLGAIEVGERRIKVDELAALISIFGKPLDFFTDPFILPPQEGQFSWRATAPLPKINAFEEKIRNILAAYRHLGRLIGRPHIQVDQSIRVKKTDSYEKVASLAEGLAETWNLGEIPAVTLRGFLEKGLGILVLRVKADHDISGAACRLPQFSSLLINREEPSYRRNYDGAHELFHLLTWETLPPSHQESPSIGASTRPREEKLADAFAAGILMPQRSLAPLWKKRGSATVIAWINKTAPKFHVSGKALYYRLINLQWISKKDVTSLNHLLSSEKIGYRDKDILPFSRIFTEKLHEAIDKGFISVRKTAKLLDYTIEELAELFKIYNLPVPFDL